MVEEKYNCSVPYLLDSILDLCVGEIAINASTYYSKLIGIQHAQCPDPCHKMQTIFGFPFLSKVDGKAFARLYFKNIVKVTDDFVSFDFLRIKYLNSIL